MVSATALNSVLAIGVVCVVIGLVAYRIAWSGPFLVLLSRTGLLPRSWRRWIEGNRH
jgi:hypothetical protein